ncbi:unnamed protein product, partial [Pelagomonas calceolata]
GARAGVGAGARSVASKSQPCDPWRPGSGGGGGVALATVDSEAVSPSKRLFLSSQKWSSAETETAPFAPSAATAAWASASRNLPPCSWHARRRASASKRAPAACRPSRWASRPVTKNSSTTSSTLWASRSRSKTTASLRRPRGAASRSGGRGGRPSPGLGVGRRSASSGCGACGSGGGGAAAAAAAARGLPSSIERVRGRFFFAVFFPVATATAALASFFADLTREFARRRVGLIGFFGGGAPPDAAPPGVPLVPACSIPGWWQRRAPTGEAAPGRDGGVDPRVRLLIRAELAPGGQGHEDARHRSWPEHGVA